MLNDEKRKESQRERNRRERERGVGEVKELLGFIILLRLKMAMKD